ncbi:TonB-dependent receptor [Porticoccaceae bacterium LTM1]|nr:TonB-dependent receptor [Porticoccaceae bacterium LTM1]
MSYDYRQQDFGNTSMIPMRRNIIAILLCGQLLPAADVLADGQSLVDVINDLRSRGYNIIYSSSLVTSRDSVPVETHTIADLAKALNHIGLTIQRRGAVWVIAQDSVARQTLTGYLLSPSGVPVASGYLVNIATGLRVEVDEAGYFQLENIQQGDTLLIGGRGYFERSIVPFGETTPPEKVMRLVLQPRDILENLIVTGSRHHLPFATDFRSHSLALEELSLIPALGGDAMHAVNHLPGISSVGVSAKPYIRGGTDDEVLILLDGAELLESFHLADYHSGYSSIDYRTIDKVDVYTGGFPARYGNRMSGVIDVTTERSEQPYNSQLGVSNLSYFFNTRHQASNYPVDWLLSVRRGDLEELTQFVDTRANDPRYFDATGRVTVALGDRAVWTLQGLVADDDISFGDAEEVAFSKLKNQYLWSRLDVSHTEQLNSATVLSYADIDRQKFHSSDVEEDGKGGFLDYRQQVRHWSLRSDYRWSEGATIWEFGAQVAYGQSDYWYLADFDRGPMGLVLGGESSVSDDINRQANGWSAGAYLAAEFDFDSWVIQPSLRWDSQHYYFSGDSQHVSPRLGISYKLNNDSRLWLSLGRFYQPEAIHELQVSDGVSEFFEPQQSEHRIVGVDWRFGQLGMKLEFYQKEYRDTHPRYENLFNPFVLLPELEPDRVQVSPQKSKASGTDFETSLPINESLSGVFRYSYLNAEDRINGQWVPRRWSQRHTASGRLSWQTESFSTSLAIIWHSGWRSGLLPESAPQDVVFPLKQVMNQMELRDYFSLDFSMMKSWFVGGNLLTLHADITNLLGRDNVAGVDYDIEEDDDLFVFEPDAEKLLPRVVSVGLVYSF